MWDILIRGKTVLKISVGKLGAEYVEQVDAEKDDGDKDSAAAAAAAAAAGLIKCGSVTQWLVLLFSSSIFNLYSS